jgi:hypothetical protein
VARLALTKLTAQQKKTPKVGTTCPNPRCAKRKSLIRLQHHYQKIASSNFQLLKLGYVSGSSKLGSFFIPSRALRAPTERIAA